MMDCKKIDARKTTKLTYDDIQNIFNYAGGDVYYRTTFNHNFVVTSGVYTFFTKCNAFWLGDLVNSYIPKIYKEMIKFDDRFFIINLKVCEDQGNERLQIQREIYDAEKEDTHYKNVVRQDIQFVDLPKGEYKFYLTGELTEANKYMFIMLSPSEY